MSADLDRRFDYHPPTGAVIDAHRRVRERVKALAEFLEEELPAGREKSLAVTKCEETLMWANAAIARAGGD